MAACERYNAETKATLSAILALIDGMPAPVEMPAAPAAEYVPAPVAEPQPVYSIPEVKIPDPLPPLGDDFKIEIPDDLDIPSPEKLHEPDPTDKGVPVASRANGEDLRTTFYTVDFKEGKPLVRESDGENNEGFTPKPKFDFSDLRFGRHKDKGKN